MSKKRPNQHLVGFVRNGVLTIEIGVNTEAFAAIRAPANWDETCRDPGERFTITNNRGFALDVVSALFDEREDGSSLIFDVLDAASRKAVEDGSEWFRDRLEDE